MPSGRRVSFERVEHGKYKFKLTETFDHEIDLPHWFFAVPHMRYMDGVLTIHAGYMWDGPSGPTIDTVDALIASLVHDALYQLIREDILPESFRRRADAELFKIARQEGMPLWRAAYWYLGLRLFGWSAV